MKEYMFLKDQIDIDIVHMYVRCKYTLNLNHVGSIRIDIVADMLSEEQVDSIQNGNSLYLFGKFTYTEIE